MKALKFTDAQKAFIIKQGNSSADIAQHIPDVILKI
jgi:hypothetical protein